MIKLSGFNRLLRSITFQKMPSLPANEFHGKIFLRHIPHSLTSAEEQDSFFV